MKVLFFGACVAPHDIEYLLNNETAAQQHAAQKVCWMFINGADKAFGKECDVLCSLRVSPYPRFKKLFAFNLKGWPRNNGARGVYVPYVNLPGLRYFSTITVAAVKLLLWNYRNRNEDKLIINYALYTPHALPAVLIAKLFDAPCILIVPDLPEFTNFSVNGAIIKKIRWSNCKIAHWAASRFDGLALFSANMVERMHIHQSKWCVIEGCAEIPAEFDAQSLATVKNAIMYSGSLNRIYGIQTLLEAFKQIDNPELYLWLCGDGDMEQDIKKAAAKDKRIIYYGCLPNSEVTAMQRSAKLLINPRSGVHEFTRYSFPSKNLEYMCSGRPVILCQMDGIPEEYYEYVFIIPDDRVESMKNTLQKVLSMSDENLNQIGARSKKFIIENKNYLKQGQKLKDLADSIIRQSEAKNHV